MKNPPFLFAASLSVLLASAITAPAARAQVTATLTTLHAFGKDVNGQQPKAGVFQAKDGNLYGTTSVNYNNGTLFKLTADGTFTSVYQFTLNLNPDSELIQTSDGSIYGTANESGAGVKPLNGGIFRLSPDGTVSIVHYFNTDGTFTDGANPTNGGLTQASDGFLYGVTANGGAIAGGPAGGSGTFYRLNADSTITVLHSFVRATEGAGPVGRLVQASDGNFYGVTTAGGTSGRGTIFRVTSSGTLTVLHTFTGSTTDGGQPGAGLIQGSDGYLYGTTAFGGGGTTSKGFPFGDRGTVFRISLAGDFTVLHSFGADGDGVAPNARLTQGRDGNFYGTTSGGGKGDANGQNLLGTVFQITPSGTFTNLHSFTGPDGGSPNGNLIQATDGSFYGTTSSGSTNDTARYGTVFRFVVTGSAHPPFFAGEVALSNGVYYLQFASGNPFGYYSYLSDPHYLFHFDLGYEYVFDANDGKSGVYLYDFKSQGFFYTAPGFPFPYLYDFSLNSVVYYYPDPSNPGHYNTNGVRYFYVFSTGKIISK